MRRNYCRKEAQKPQKFEEARLLTSRVSGKRSWLPQSWSSSFSLSQAGVLAIKQAEA
jgi:hypothetical protein